MPRPVSRGRDLLFSSFLGGSIRCIVSPWWALALSCLSFLVQIYPKATEPSFVNFRTRREVVGSGNEHGVALPPNSFRPALSEPLVAIDLSGDSVLEIDRYGFGGSCFGFPIFSFAPAQNSWKSLNREYSW